MQLYCNMPQALFVLRALMLDPKGTIRLKGLSDTETLKNELKGTLRRTINPKPQALKDRIFIEKRATSSGFGWLNTCLRVTVGFGLSCFKVEGLNSGL